MEILDIDPRRPQPDAIARAAALARRGVPVAFPTDTVYGLGVAVLPQGSPDALFALKRRDPAKAVPWLVDGIGALEEYGEKVPAYAFELARAHWPGALTLVVRASEAAPPRFVARDGSLALRAPAHPVPHALVRALGTPLATTSANLQGGEAALERSGFAPALVERLSLMLDGGPTPGDQPSTIVSCLGAEPRLLRSGALLLHCFQERAERT
jgi:tRNA threonylcarbamoyl adenosine modification protein (Sua5/YciO/YrdC/YwlC family)